MMLKIGAQPGNRNAVTHGVRGWLTLGSLPKGASYVRRVIGTMRTQVENAVLAKKSEIGLTDSALIQTACRHEGRAMLIMRYLRRRGDAMTDGERLAYLKEFGNASDARDRALKALGLDLADRGDVFSRLYDVPATPTEPSGGGNGKPEPSAAPCCDESGDPDPKHPEQTNATDARCRVWEPGEDDQATGQADVVGATTEGDKGNNDER